MAATMAVEISIVKTDNQLTHSRRNLVVTVPQYLKEGVAQSSCAGPQVDPLFDEEGANLLDRRCPSGDQARSDAMAGLQIELGATPPDASLIALD